MTFHDLKLPKELAKKKKLELFKCWILDPLTAKDPTRILEFNTDRDRFGLTPNAAFHIALGSGDFSKIWSGEPNAHTDILEIVNNKVVVIMKITLTSGAMEEEVLIPPEASTNFNTDPQYNPTLGTLYATVHGRVADCNISNYKIDELQMQSGENGEPEIASLKLSEIIINSAVTGGK